jgi:predicted dehydrogenase
MRIFGDEPQWCFAHIRQGDRDITAADVRDGDEGIGSIAGNNLTAYYAFPNGIAGIYDSYATPSGHPMELIVEGTLGSLVWYPTHHKAYLRHDTEAPGADGLCREPIEWTAEERAFLEENGGWYRNANRRMALGLIDCIEHGGTHFSSGENARWAMEMYFGAIESQRQGGRVDLPLKQREPVWM